MCACMCSCGTMCERVCSYACSSVWPCVSVCACTFVPVSVCVPVSWGGHRGVAGCPERALQSLSSPGEVVLCWEGPGRIPQVWHWLGWHSHAQPGQRDGLARARRMGFLCCLSGRRLWQDVGEVLWGLGCRIGAVAVGKGLAWGTPIRRQLREQVKRSRVSSGHP